MVSCGTVKTTLDVAPGDLGLSPLVAVSSSLVGMVGSVRLDHRAVESPVSLGQHFGIAPLQSKPRADFNSALQRGSPGDKSLCPAAAWLGDFPLLFGTVFSSLKQSTDRVFRALASVQTLRECLCLSSRLCREFGQTCLSFSPV